MKDLIWLILISLTILLSCKDPDMQLVNGELRIWTINDSDSNTTCSYFFDTRKVLKRKMTENKLLKTGTLIHYFENGNPESIQSFKNEQLDGNTIVYFENGIISQIRPYENGMEHGESILYYQNGFVKAINLIFEDSLYFVRVFSDSMGAPQFQDNYIPIVYLNNDKINDNRYIEVKIRFPLYPSLGLIKDKFIIYYDMHSEDFIKDIIPIARHSQKITGDDIVVTLNPDKHETNIFYCYITDLTGKTVGPIIQRKVTSVVDRDGLRSQ